MLSRNSLHILALRAANLAFVLGTGVLLARLLGPSEYGTYAFVLAIVSLIGIFGAYGLPELLTREIAVCDKKEDYSRLKGLSIRAFQIGLGISATLAVAAYVWMSLSKAANLTDMVAFLAALLVPIQTVAALRSGALRGLGYVRSSQLPELLVQPSVFLGVVAITWLVLGDMALQDAMVSRVVAAMIALLVGMFLLAKAMPEGVRAGKPIYETAKWAGSAKSFMFISALWVVLGQADIVILGMLRSHADVGVYKVSMIGGSLVMYVLLSINTVLGPMIASAAAEADTETIRSLVKKAARLATLMGVPITAVIIIFGEQLIELVFGADYIPAYQPMAILAVAHIFNAVMGSVGLTLNMTGHEKLTYRAQMFAVVFNVMLNFALIPQWGPLGAAIATAVAVVISNTLLAYFVLIKLKFNPTVFGRVPGDA